MERSGMSVKSSALFGIVLPDGSKHGRMTRREATDCMAWMPYGSRIDPPIPPGNEMALRLLDRLCDMPNSVIRVKKEAQ
jgi:hypothetical protein